MVALWGQAVPPDRWREKRLPNKYLFSCHLLPPTLQSGTLTAELEAETCLSPWSNEAGTSAPEGSGVFNPHSAFLCCVASYIRCPSLCLFLRK